MVARQMMDFIENGNITNSVNMPACRLPRNGKCRITVVHKNAPGVLNDVTAVISGAGINIANMLSQAKGDYAYLILDLDDAPAADMAAKLEAMDTVIKVRVLG